MEYYSTMKRLSYWCNYMDDSEKRYIKQKKPYSCFSSGRINFHLLFFKKEAKHKEYTLYDSIYMSSRTGKINKWWLKRCPGRVKRGSWREELKETFRSDVNTLYLNRVASYTGWKLLYIKDVCKFHSFPHLSLKKEGKHFPTFPDKNKTEKVHYQQTLTERNSSGCTSDREKGSRMES